MSQVSGYMYFSVKKLRAAVFIVAGLGLSGCLSLLPDIREAPSVYRLSQPAANNLSESLGVVVKINRPITSKALSGDDIVLSPSDFRIAYAPESRWVEPIPSLLQNALINAMAQQPGLSAIGHTNAARSDYSLQVNLRAFEAVFDQGDDNAPLATAILTATLTQTDGRVLIGQTQVSTSERANSRNVSEIVRAQRLASEEAVQALSTWVAQHTTPNKS